LIGKGFDFIIAVFKQISIGVDNSKKITCALARRGIGIENAGHVKLCNLSTHIFKDAKGNPFRIDQTKLDDIWRDNVTRKEINESLDNGERHPNCQLCWTAEDAGVKSIRQIMNEKYPERGDSLPDTPSIVNMKPGNLCNFGCRFCSAEDSNQLYDIDFRLNRKEHRTWEQYLESYASYKKSFQKDSEFWNVMNNWAGGIEHYALYGGEPFVNKPLFDMLEYNHQNGHSQKQDLYISTNASVWSEKYNEILKSFSKVIIGMSIDGTGKHFEYIRHPGKWDKIKDNIDRFRHLRDQHKNIELKVAATCNPFNIYYLDDLCDYFQPLGVVVDIHLIQVPACYDARVLPDVVKGRVIEKLQHRDDLRHVLDFLNSELPNREQNLKEFVYLTKGTDAIRNEKFSETFPEFNQLLIHAGVNI